MHCPQRRATQFFTLNWGGSVHFLTTSYQNSTDSGPRCVLFLTPGREVRGAFPFPISGCTFFTLGDWHDMATWLLVYGRRQFLERFPAHQAHGLQQHYYYSHVPHATFCFLLYLNTRRSSNCDCDMAKCVAHGCTFGAGCVHPCL